MQILYPSYTSSTNEESANGRPYLKPRKRTNIGGWNAYQAENASRIKAQYSDVDFTNGEHTKILSKERKDMPSDEKTIWNKKAEEMKVPSSEQTLLSMTRSLQTIVCFLT